MKENRFQLILLSLALCFITKVQAQCLLYEIPLHQRMNESELVIEAEVVSVKSYWNKSANMIYSASKLNVYKVIKGEILADEVFVISAGGELDNKKLVSAGLPVLKEKDLGVFMLIKTDDLQFKKEQSDGAFYQVYSGWQGFIRYDKKFGNATDVFHEYTSLPFLIDNLSKMSPDKLIQLKEIDYSIQPDNETNRAVPVINSISPEYITAGNSSVLIIKGSGFGSSAIVKFNNADDGGKTKVEPLPNQYLSRNDSEIMVHVPDNAGSGKVQVVNGTVANSSAILKVKAAHSNVPTTKFLARFIDHSGGGYQWQMTSDFENNLPAKEAFLRAFTRWRCSTGVNWTMGKTSSADKMAMDNINTIRFDKGNELPAGVLGLCMSYYSQCEPGNWYVSELDIVFNDATKWSFSTSNVIGNAYDFETIVLHELGHGHQLGHVINSNDLMHYSLPAGLVKRELNDDNLSCASSVMENSIQSTICSHMPMQRIPVNYCNDLSYGFFDFDEINVSPNPFINQAMISFEISAQTSIEAYLFDEFGRKISTIATGVHQPGRHVFFINKNLQQIHAGVYTIALYLNGVLKTKKIISL